SRKGWTMAPARTWRGAAMVMPRPSRHEMKAAKRTPRDATTWAASVQRVAVGEEGVEGTVTVGQELRETKAYSTREAGLAAGARVVGAVVMLDLARRRQIAAAGRAERDGHDAPERQRVGHLDEHAALGDVARDRRRLAVELAHDHHRKRLVEAHVIAVVGRPRPPWCSTPRRGTLDR